MGGDSSLGHRQMAESVGGGEKAEGPPPTEEIPPGAPKAAPQGPPTGWAASRWTCLACIPPPCPAGEQREGRLLSTCSVRCVLALSWGLAPPASRPAKTSACAYAADAATRGEGAGPANRGSWCWVPAQRGCQAPHPTLLCAFTATSLSSNTLWAGTSSRGSRALPPPHLGLGAPPMCSPGLAHGGRMNTCTRAAGVGVTQRGWAVLPFGPHTAKGNGALPKGPSLILRCCF